MAEEAREGIKALKSGDFLTAAYCFDQAKSACLSLGGHKAEPINMCHCGNRMPLPGCKCEYGGVGCKEMDTL